MRCGQSRRRRAYKLVQYEWSEPVNVNKVESIGLSIARVPVNCRAALAQIATPESYNILFWNGSDFAPYLSRRSWQSTGHV